MSQLQSDISILSGIAENIHENSVLYGLSELSDKLISKRFYLVTIGLFKRGKSSLINALIGEELAPVAVTPLTSVITFFEYDKNASAEVIFQNGTKIPIELPDVVNYVSEENNPKNRKQVQYLKIFAKAKILENIILVDTPGLGSLFAHNSDTTLSFLPRIDAGLFMLSADLPISKADEELLKQIRHTITNVLFVINKSDLLSQEELDKIITYNTVMLNEIIGSDYQGHELIPVSAKQFFMSKAKNGFPDSNAGNIRYLKDMIEDRIVESKDEILIANSINRLFAFSDQLHTLLRVKSDTLQLPVQELENKRNAMQGSIDYLASGKDDFEAIVINRIKQLRDTVTERTEQERKELTHYCQELLIKNAVKTWNKIKESDADVFYNELFKYLISRFDKLKTGLEKLVKEEFSGILLQYSRQSQSFLYEIVRQMKEILGINIEGIISSFDLDVYTSFYFKEEIKYTIPSLKTKLIYKIMPDILVRRQVLNQIFTNCIDLVNPNAGRIRSDIDYKISESFRKFKNNFDQKLYELLQSLKNLIEESIKAKLSIHENISDILLKLQDQQNNIEEIKNHYAPGEQDKSFNYLQNHSSERTIS